MTKNEIIVRIQRTEGRKVELLEELERIAEDLRTELRNCDFMKYIQDRVDKGNVNAYCILDPKYFDDKDIWKVLFCLKWYADDFTKNTGMRITSIVEELFQNIIKEHPHSSCTFKSWKSYYEWADKNVVMSPIYEHKSNYNK